MEKTEAKPDEILADIADYVADYEVTAVARNAARLCFLDALACAFDESALKRRFAPQRYARIMAFCHDAERFERTPVHEVVDLLRA